MKVLHVINSMTIGGAEVLVANTLSAGGLQNHTENTLVYFKGSSELLSRIDSKVKIICLNYSNIIQLPGVLRKLRKIIRENKIDIIHSHLNPSDFYVNLIRPRNIPQVHTLHIAYSTDLETRPLLKLLEQKLFFNRKNCNLIYLSEFNKRDFLDTVKFRGRSFVLHNFIDDVFFLHPPREYKGSEERGLKLIAVGNFRKQKNYFYLLDIFKHLKEHNIHLDIYGGGDNEKYSQVINDNGLKVTLKGLVSDINAVIAEYDLLIMPSTNEGFALSVFEAMAASVPVAISNIPPLKSIVKEHAIYFELDNAAIVAKQLLEVYRNNIDINELAVNAKKYAGSTVRRQTYIQELLKIYEVVINKSKHPLK